MKTAFLVSLLLGLFCCAATLRCYSNYAGRDSKGKHQFDGPRKELDCDPAYDRCILAKCNDGDNLYACGESGICKTVSCGPGTTQCSSCTGDLCNGDGGLTQHHLLSLLGSLAMAAIVLVGVPHIL